jgi:phage N-6-adenine-methyltransferase
MGRLTTKVRGTKKSTAIAKSTGPAINLAVLGKQIARLVKSGDLEGLKELHAKAEGVEAYIRSKRPEREAGLDAQGFAAHAVLLVERGIGSALATRPRPDNLKKGPRPSKKEVREKLRDMGISDKQSHRWQRLAKMDLATFEARVAAILEKGRRATTSGALKETASEAKKYDGDEHWTPADYIDLVREVLGSIDLDPATSLKAQETVVAQQFYTKQDDGLSKEWAGRVFLNPPYSDPAPFVEKLLEALGTGAVPEAIVLTNNTTDTTWAQSLLEASAAVCFTRGRIAFDRPDSKANKGTRQGQIFFYLGNDADSFIAAFEEFNFDADKEPVRNAILRPSSPLHVPEEAEAAEEDEAEEKPAASGEWFEEERPEASA